jgi:hypothetical protein
VSISTGHHMIGDLRYLTRNRLVPRTITCSIKGSVKRNISASNGSGETFRDIHPVSVAKRLLFALPSQQLHVLLLGGDNADRFSETDRGARFFRRHLPTIFTTRQWTELTSGRAAVYPFISMNSGVFAPPQ